MLNSHPDRSLQKHVDEVRSASQKIWLNHSGALRSNLGVLEDWIEWTVALHDAGKGSEAFQVYISDPKKYRGNKKAKAHTPLSTLVAIKTGEAFNWEWQKTLCVAVCAASHHSRFKTADELSRYWHQNEWQEILETQVAGLNWSELADSLRCKLSRFEASVKSLQEVGLELEEEVFEDLLHEMEVDDAVRYRLTCQLTHSILLEADKAFLIMDEEERDMFRHHKCRKLSPKLIDDYINSFSANSKLDSVRQKVRGLLTDQLADTDNDSRVETMTLPTGSGKTLLAASWLLHHRNRLQTETHTPPIVIVLPFLSIIDQTQKEYLKFLPEDSGLLAYHSLSTREHGDTENDDVAEFFLDTWYGDVIITTFDQFLLALLEPRTRHQMRFHQLLDALIVMDEVQALPFHLWDIVNQCLTKLTEMGNARVLAMSATQPGFLPNATPLIENVDSVFGELSRYEIDLQHYQNVSIDCFVEKLKVRANGWKKDRVLIVLNTRKSARAVRDALAEDVPVLFLTADITPRDRLATIKKIKDGTSCIVVATQCVEAGVDIDMTHVIRDFAPLDSIVQVAGRCNRHGNRPTETIEIVDLVNKNGKRFSEMIYDRVLLQITRKVLGRFCEFHGSNFLPEDKILPLTKEYFALASDPNEGKSIGIEITSKFARWEEFGDVHELLRGQKGRQIQFVVIEQSPELRDRLLEASLINDRWDKRREIRKLASELAEITVSIYANDEIAPTDFADLDATGNFLMLKKGYYKSNRGIDLDGNEEAAEDSWGKCL